MAVVVRSRGVRVVRGLVVASLSVGAAGFSHVAGGGAVPGALGTILALAFAILACIGLGSRVLSPVRLSIAVALSQLVFHVLFSLGARIPAGSGHGSVGMLGMVMSGGQTVRLPDFASPQAVAVETMSDARMWLGHSLAAVVTILLILHGERSLLSLLRLGAARLVRLAVVVEAMPAAPEVLRHGVAAAIGDVRGIRPLGVLLAARPHRGPPSFV